MLAYRAGLSCPSPEPSVRHLSCWPAKHLISCRQAEARACKHMHEGACLEEKLVNTSTKKAGSGLLSRTGEGWRYMPPAGQCPLQTAAVTHACSMPCAEYQLCTQPWSPGAGETASAPGHVIGSSVFPVWYSCIPIITSAISMTMFHVSHISSSTLIPEPSPTCCADRAFHRQLQLCNCVQHVPLH